MVLFTTKEEMSFLKVGDKVKAIARVWDLPGNFDPGPVRAEPGDEGVCIWAQEGHWPAVEFANGITDVTPEEVEKI